MKKKILYILLVLTALVGCVLGARLIFREPKSKVIEEQPNNHEIENEKKEDNKQTVDKETLEESKEEIIQENQKEEVSDKKEDSTGEQSNSNNQSANSAKPNNSSSSNSSNKPTTKPSTNNQNTTTKPTEQNTPPKTEEPKIWEQLGITEDEYNNSPMLKWQKVTHSSFSACQLAGEEATKIKVDETTGKSYQDYSQFWCYEVNSYSGKTLGYMLSLK